MQAYEGLHKAVQSLCESLGKALPELPEDDTLTRLDAGPAGGVKSVQASQQQEATGPWDDAETAAFYESLPDIKYVLGPTVMTLKHTTRADSVKLGFMNVSETTI